MRWKQIEDEPKVFALIFETGDEIASVLQHFSKHQGLGGSSFKAIGALSHAKLGWFNWKTKKYDPACVLDEQVELLWLIGDIALKDGESRKCMRTLWSDVATVPPTAATSLRLACVRPAN